MKKFVSLDVEATGLTPGNHSILSVGLVAVLPGPDGWYCDETKKYSANIHRRWPIGSGHEGGPNTHRQATLAGDDFHPETLKWWESQTEAWRLCRLETQDPYDVALEICDWAKKHDLWDATLVAWPSAFDVPHFRSLFIGAEDPPFGYGCFCLSTAKTVLKASGMTHKFDVSNEGITEHEAISDAVFQGRIAAALLNYIAVAPD